MTETVEFREVSDSVFIVPSDYKKITYSEYQKIMSQPIIEN